jgi:hypothetical protein
LSQELDRMLRRVLARSLPESLLEQAIAKEIARLLNEPDAAPDMPPLPGAGRLPANTFAAAIETAHRALGERRFAAAIAAVRSAAEAQEARRRLAAAVAERSTVAAERERRVREIGLAPSVNLPALRILDRLLALSAKLLTGQEALKASVVARLARQLMERLFARQSGPGAELEARLERLARVGGTPAAAERLAQARDLALQGYANLASHLADELELEAAARRAAAVAGGARQWRNRVVADLAAMAAEADALRSRLKQIAAPGGDT